MELDPTTEKKKEFALSQIAPYYKDPNTCGYDRESDDCLYLTSDGRMCVAGKNMIKPKKDMIGSIYNFIKENQKVLKREVRGLLNTEEWESLQKIHDTIARRGNKKRRLIAEINNLGLFTFEELEEYASKL